jgi:hypothetical protein
MIKPSHWKEDRSWKSEARRSRRTVLSYDVVQVRMSFPSDIGQDRTDRREEGVSFVVNDGLNSGDKISDPGKVFFMAGDDEFDQRHGIIQKDAI